MSSQGNSRRAVIVSGVRTPFTKAFSELASLDSIDLGVAACRALLDKTPIDVQLVDEINWGSVVVKTAAPNLAREIVLDLNLPSHIPGVTLTRACLSGLQAVTHAAANIERGDHEVVIAGGSDSTSNAEMPMPAGLVKALGKLSFGGKLTTGKVMRALAEIKTASDILPSAPKIAERSTGRTMGQHADQMARINEVSRAAQDQYALESHAKAYAAQQSGILSEEIGAVSVAGRKLDRDTLIRASVNPKKLASLKPVFDKQGTVTAASSSPLTDGASAVLLMSQSKAKELGLPADVALVDWTYTALDPFEQLLLGPAFAIPKLLDKQGLGIDDIDVFEIHEAFAAQVLSVLKALASEDFCRQRLGRDTAFGEIPADKINPYGGSIALGHPFAATGGRLITTAANELRRRGQRRAVVTLCAAGAMGGAALLERLD